MKHYLQLIEENQAKYIASLVEGDKVLVEGGEETLTQKLSPNEFRTTNVAGEVSHYTVWIVLPKKL